MSKSTAATKSIKPTIEVIDAALEGFTTTSSKIRYLNSVGMPRGEIAKKLNKRYQHVRNVLITPLATK